MNKLFTPVLVMVSAAVLFSGCGNVDISKNGETLLSETTTAGMDIPESIDMIFSKPQQDEPDELSEMAGIIPQPKSWQEAFVDVLRFYATFDYIELEEIITAKRIHEDMAELIFHRIIGNEGEVVIRIYDEEGNLVQVIKDVRQNGYRIEPGYLEFMDFNFDGFLDMRMFITSHGGFQPDSHIYWLWNPEKMMFEQNEQLSHMEWMRLDHETGEIIETIWNPYTEIYTQDEEAAEWTVEELGAKIEAAGVFWNDWWFGRGRFAPEHIVAWGAEILPEHLADIYLRLLPASGFESLSDIRNYLLRYYTECWVDMELSRMFAAFVECDNVLYIHYVRMCFGDRNWETAEHVLIEQDVGHAIVATTVLVWHDEVAAYYEHRYRFTFIDGGIAFTNMQHTQ